VTDRLPWDDLRTPASGYGWLRTDLSPKYRFWWGKAQNGCPVLLFEFGDSHADLFREKRPKVNGLSIDLVSLTDVTKHGLIISLVRPSDADIFYRLCLSIIRAADAANTEAQAVTSVLNHLDRWRDFLANARWRLLSPDEVRGLFAELSVMRILIEEYLQVPSNVVAAWQGPLRKPQDFKFSNGSIEVKAIGGAKAHTVQISSELQLQDGAAPLFLVAVELLDRNTDSSGKSLNDLVRSVETLVGEDIAKSLRDRLAIAGYAEVLEYDAPRFEVGHIEVYRVIDDFPAIRGSDLKSGISRVRYDLDLNSARAFLIPKISIWEPQ
jgi:hypothetical protein